MKLLIFLASILLAGCLAAQSSQPLKASVHSKGTAAGMVASSGNSDIIVEVVRTDSGNQTNTFLDLDVFTITDDGFVDTSGFGSVPDNFFTGDGTKHISLSIDLSQPNLPQLTTCTFSSSTLTTTCQPGQPGIIQLEFQQNGAGTSSFTSESHDTFVQFSDHIQRKADAVAAFVTGSVLGLPVVNGAGSIAENHDTTLTFIRNQ